MTHRKTVGDSWHTYKKEGRYFSLLKTRVLVLFLGSVSSSFHLFVSPLLPFFIPPSSSPTLPSSPFSILPSFLPQVLEIQHV